MTDYRKIYADATSPEWARGLERLPPHMVDGMVRYIVQGVPPGSFMSAVLSGDLFGALRRADDVNRNSLPEYGTFLSNYAPCGCFGSEDRFDEWVQAGGLRGFNREAAE